MMKTRLVSGVLCAALLVSLATPAFAAQPTTALQEAAQVLAALDIMTGDETGELYLERQVTRAEFTKLTVAASPYADSSGPAASVAPYPDVPKNHWAAPAVQLAKEKDVVKGYLDGTFRPMSNIALVEGVSMALSLLGYQSSDFSGAWGSGQMALYRTLKLDMGIALGQSDPMTRQDALWLFYNLLTAKTKAGQPYITVLGYALTPAGELDRVGLINAAMEGPLLARSGWQERLPFDAAAATVYRAGAPSNLAALQPTDVLYYSKPMRTIWGYTNQVTGAIQKLAPAASAPTAVTVAGQTYQLETSAVAYQLSDLGQFKVGDTVTLLLGRTGSVAALTTPGEAAGTVYGLVTALGAAAYEDGRGGSHMAGTLYLTATDGSPYSYRWEGKEKELEPGDLVRVTTTATGAKVEKLVVAPITGKFDQLELASNVEILDTYGKTTALRIYPARLAGVALKEGMVRYHAVNEQGEITHMVLNDVTGDAHRYGVLTVVSEEGMGMMLASVYTYQVEGTPAVHTTTKASWNLTEGPCQIKSDGGAVERIANLSALGLTVVEGNRATAGNKTYTLSDTVAVYERRGENYYLTDLAHLSKGAYTLTAWQDKAETAGGRIRVLVGEQAAIQSATAP